MAYGLLFAIGPATGTGLSDVEEPPTEMPAPWSRPVDMTIAEDDSPVITRRIVDRSTGEYIKPDQVWAIEVRVYDLDGDDPREAIWFDSLHWAECLFSEPTVDGTWDRDGIGFTFQTQLAHTAFPDGSHAYMVEVTFRLLGTRAKRPSYDEVRLWRIKAIPRWGS